MKNKILEYDNFEYAPIYEENGICEPIYDDTLSISFFTIYAHKAGKGVVSILDVTSEKLAKKIVKFLNKYL